MVGFRQSVLSVGATALSRVESFKQCARIKAGALLHAMDAYRKLMPAFLPEPSPFLLRLRSYLYHYYEQASQAEATLYLPDLGLKFACDIKDHMLWPYIEGRSLIYEIGDIRHGMLQVRADDHILDIGANHGFWGFALANRAGAGAQLSLCEANPDIIKRLQKTKQLNRNIHASLLPFAISDGTTKELTFYLPQGELSGLGSTVLHELAASQGWLSANRKITVPSRSLDDLMDAGLLTGMDIVKIDVEHAEDAVIRGGLRAIRHYRPRFLMVETSPDSWASNTLRELGYSNYILDEAGNETPVSAGYWGNIYFTIDYR